MIQIKLENKTRWKQASLGEHMLYFTGHLYQDETLYTEETIQDYFENIEFSPEYNSKWTGNFAFIYQTPEYTFAACDRKRSIPLFYWKNGENWIISDRILPQKAPLDETAVMEFLLTGYAANEKTLYKNVCQIEAGQALLFEADSFEKHQYFRYYHSPEQIDLETASKQLEDVFHRVFKRLHERLKDKHVMIPLSGGYDSRIIALLLKEYGVQNISSFTYGRLENNEARKSKEIADKLGIDWTFYEYSRNDWKKWYESADWKQYADFGTNASVMAHLQDWPAVSQLAKQADTKYVFMPGHSGDFVAGSHLMYELTIDKEYTIDEVVERIMGKHHRLWETHDSSKSNVISEIKSSLAGLPYQNREQASALFEYWDWKERQAKFIINSVRVYEYYDHEWEIPLWDDELMNFFLTIPVDLRFKKYLYDYTLHQMYPALFEKPVKKDMAATSLKQKYGPLYSQLKKAYNKKRVLQQYYKDPMEWYGIYGNYFAYLQNISFTHNRVRYSNPYNINSFLVKDYIHHLKG
ncbi:asparagine synthase-related protein [Fredinandcohnia humi]